VFGLLGQGGSGIPPDETPPSRGCGKDAIFGDGLAMWDGTVKVTGMRALPPTGFTSVIHAAGGLVWRPGNDEPELVLVRRRRYGDEWSLPKGKLDPGESWEEAALREVREETGFETELVAPAGGQVYRVKQHLKVVLYWHMRVRAETGRPDPDEVTALQWATPARALELLTYPRERELLQAALASRPDLSSPPAPPASEERT
jgi:8-oxo-dGTP diphosphatase